MHMLAAFLWAMEWSSWGLGTGAALAFAALVYLCRYQVFIRFPLWLLRHTFYRVHVHGVENVPATGPALLVSNHVSWIDFLIILGSQKRKVRFLAWAPFFGVPFLRVLFR